MSMEVEAVARRRFLEQRRGGIGGSDAAAVVGLDPYKSALDVYLEKVEGVQRVTNPTPPMLRGIALEPIIIDQFKRVTGRKLRRQPQRVLAEKPWMIGNIDRQQLPGPQNRDRMGVKLNGPGICEAKAPGARTFTRIVHNGLPPHYICQMQHYLGVYGYDWGSFAIFNADLWKLVYFDVAADPDFIGRLVEAEERFWKDHIEPKRPPDDTREAFDPASMPVVPGDVIRRSDESWKLAVTDYREAKALKETADDVLDTAKAMLKEAMGGAYGVVEGAGARVYMTQRPGRATLDKGLITRHGLDAQKVAATIATMHPELVTDLTPALLTDCRLDLATVEKVGKGFDDFRVYSITGRDDVVDEA